MANVSGNAGISFSFVQKGALGTNPNGSIPESDTWSIDLANGTLLDQVNLMHAKTYTLAASTPQTINLNDGSLLDVVGGPAAFVRVVVIAWRVQSTNNAHIVLLGGAGPNEWVGWLTAGSKATAFPSTAANPGTGFQAAPNTSGMPVSGTSKLLKIDPGANAVGAFDLVILGRNS